ncbi:ABC transporter ATP-binding protein [Alkalihalobacterium alkalinitrilicum]|uniref:ABC transporter ATP-binding protein n=1 Tax=Alkalihalobacterium alkalinitrilicum TaxID=427920 RepID=UPI000994D94D|nr:ABC transporter ATP-binding protein [Alkalihalobacterium alkalinitrilicum]
MIYTVSNEDREYERKPLIQISGLEKSYPLPRKRLFQKKSQVTILKNINLEINTNETVALVGESGSGKTTLGECIGGLRSIPHSTVYFNGKCINELKKEERTYFRKSVQFVFQNPHSSVNPRMTVYDILREPISIHKLTKTKKEEQEMILQLLEDVGLPSSLLHSKAKNLSGGQCQRLAIARAISLKPPLIICDEAVSALDVSVQATIIQLLQSLQKKYGLSYLFISHDLGVVRAIADRVVVLKNGEIVEEQLSEELFNQPKHSYTKELLSSVL